MKINYEHRRPTEYLIQIFMANYNKFYRQGEGGPSSSFSVHRRCDVTSHSVSTVLSQQARKKICSTKMRIYRTTFPSY